MRKIRSAMLTVLAFLGTWVLETPAVGSTNRAADVPRHSECTFDVSEFGRTASTSPELIRLQDQLVDPAVTVTQQLIRALASQSAAETLRVPAPSVDPADMKLARLYARKEREFVGKYLDLLAKLVPLKTGPAKAESLATLAANQLLRAGPMTEEVQRCFERTMADILPDLPFEELWGVLSKDTYPSFQSPKLTAFLRELYESLDRQISEPGDLHFYRTGILKCIYEVDPAMGREMIFKEIVSSRPRADIEVLRLLSDETLPEIDAELSRQLPETYENAGWHEFGAKLAIVERYATPAIVGSVKAVYLKDDGWHREREALFIAYFLRTEPAFGKYLIERHLKLGSSDSDTLLTDIEGVRPFPQLRDIAREHLYNPDKRIAANAAYVFKSMGNHDVELLLWNLLKAWHEAWANKTESIPFEEQSYQDALVEALLFGGGPCRSKEVLEKLRSIYIKGRSSNGNIELPPWHEPVIIIADARRASNPEFRVEFCGGPLTVEQLKTNIPQFPKGTEFEWRGDRRPEDAKLEAVFREIERLVETEGMSIHR